MIEVFSLDGNEPFQINDVFTPEEQELEDRRGLCREIPCLLSVASVANACALGLCLERDARQEDINSHAVEVSDIHPVS